MDTSTPLLTKKNIIITLVLLILAISIPLGVQLVQQQTQLKSKAAASPGGEIKFVGSNVEGPGCAQPTGVCEAKSSNIEIQLTSPFGPP